MQDKTTTKPEIKGGAAPMVVPARIPRSWIILVGLLTAAIAALWWWLSPIKVTIMLPIRGDAAEVVYATGVVEPRSWAKVSALVRKRIVEICDCEGEEVKKGDVLARLDDQEERALLAELQTRRDRFMEDANRLKALVDRNVASRVAYDDKLTQLREYDARIAAQKDRIANLQLRSPVDGIILRHDGHVGEIAGTTSSDVLFWVGQPKPLRIVAEVNEEDIAKVREGQKVLLRHEGFRGAPLEATIGEITPKGDPATKTFRVYFALPDDTPLMIGMSIEANIVVREAKGVLLLPADVIRDGYVFAVNGSRLARAPVKTGIKGTRLVEIVSGVTADTMVVAPIRADLKEGMRVTATVAPPPRPSR